MSNVRLCAALILTLAVFSAYGQPGFSAGISPVPLYPLDGKIPPDLSGQFVFLDTRTFDLVLSYPTGPDANVRTVRTLELATHVEPVVTVSVTKTPAGSYLYRYEVANQPGAKQSIKRWFLPTPEPEAPDPARVIVTDPVRRENGWGRIDRYSYRPGEWAVRWEREPQSLEKPGERIVFSWESPHKPGMVQAFFQGDVADTRPAGGLPQAVLQQLEVVQQLQFNSKPVLTVGPKYEARTPKLVIAGDFHFFISRSINGRLLRGDSPFVKESLEKLNQFLERPRPEGAPPSANEPFPPIAATPSPNSAIEQALQMAMKLALDFE